MFSYLLKRLFGLIPLLIGISLMSFFVIHLSPGSPTDAALGDLNPKVSYEARQKMEKLYDLDKPLWVQYKKWFTRILRFDFGTSLADGRPVIDKFLETIPVTLAVNGLSLLLILLFGIPAGVIAAVKKGALFDKMSAVVMFAAFALPAFWLALVLMDLFGVKLGWLPVSGLTSLDFEYFSGPQKIADLARHLALPVAVSALASLAGISRYIRNQMNDVLEKPYILAARSRNLPERVVLYKHGLKNALLPVISILGLSVPGLIGGSVIFESIFAIPGTGRLFFLSVMSRDYPVIMAMLVTTAFLTIIGSLLADLGYACVDPRIRYAAEEK
ncbi:MAG: ABC transporter permease [Candidatus Omnitrophota bacterium]